MNNIIVTGGYGFIGSNFINLVHPEYDNVYNIDCCTYAADIKNVENVPNVKNYLWDLEMKYNIKKIKNMIEATQPKWLVHFAAESHVDNSISSPADFINTNFHGTLNILEALEGTGVNLLYISTDEVYGSLPLNSEVKDYWTESAPHHPNSPYAASKAAAEMVVMGYCKTYNIPYIMTNGSNTYGPRQHTEKFIPKVISRALHDKRIPIYGNGSNVRDWIYVLDVCHAIRMITLRGVIGERYNIGTYIDLGADTPVVATEIVSNLELGKYILKSMGKSEELLEFVTDRPAHDLRYCVNAGKLHKHTGWYPKVGMIEGLDRTINWYTNKLKHK